MSVDTARSLVDDAERLDRTLRGSVMTPAHLLDELVESTPTDARESAARAFPRGSAGMRDLVALGRSALWLATSELLAVLPGQRVVPFPPHERWDALLEIHREVPEAAWLFAEVFASLRADQAGLGARALRPVERRFGDRGWAILEVRAGRAHLSELLRETRP